MTEEALTNDSTPFLKISYRPARLSELAEIQRLLTETGLTFHSFDKTNDEAGMFGHILNFICEQDGRIIAVLQSRDLSPEHEILNIAVDQAFRRKGIATLLLANFLHDLERSGVSEVFLEVRESNFAARSLYRKFSFIESGHRPAYYRDPVESAVLLRRRTSG